MSFENYFPNIDNYDMRKIGHILLYAWHFDMYAIRGAIEYINDALSASIANEIEKQHIFNAEDEWEQYSDAAIECAHLHQISRYVFNSCVLSIYAVVESCLDRYCTACANEYNLKISLDDIQGKGISRAITYLEKVVGINDLKSDGLHGKISVINHLRNDLIHRAGKATPKKIQAYKEELGVDVSEKGIIELTYENAVNIYSLCDDFLRFVLSKERTR